MVLAAGLAVTGVTSWRPVAAQPSVTSEEVESVSVTMRAYGGGGVPSVRQGGDTAEAVGQQVPLEAPNHVPQDSPLTHNTRPPTSGEHYPTWVQTFGMFDPAPPTGNWVHNLEHGAVAILYNCPDGCPDVVQQLADLYPTLPLSRSSRGAQARVLIMPYADMDTKIAAVAWGWLLQQDDLNTDELRAFVEQHVDRGPECVNLACP